LLDFDCIVNNKVHEFVKALELVSTEEATLQIWLITNPNLSLNPNGQLLIEPNLHGRALLE